MQYRVTIKETSGQQTTKTVDADSRFAVYQQVHNDGGVVVSLAEQSGFALKIPSKWNINITTGIRKDKIIAISKNLAGMLGAGLTLARSLSVIERQSKNKNLKAVIVDVENSVRQGSTFHDALAKHKNVFSDLYIAMVRSGEETGALADALTTVATQMEKTENLRKKIKGAMIYPSIVISAVVGVAVLMMIYVVPTLTATFKSLNVKVPLATRIISGISDFMVANIPLTFGTIAGIVIAGVLFARSHFGRQVILAGALYVPVIGELVRETMAARAARTLSSLLSSGVPLIRALEITEDVVGDNVFAVVIKDASVRVGKGEAVSAAFLEHPDLFPILMSDMLSVGEETGKVAEMLSKISDLYETDVEQRTKDLSAIIEPLLMLIIGSGVGLFAVAIISPIYSLSSAI